MYCNTIIYIIYYIVYNICQYHCCVKGRRASAAPAARAPNVYIEITSKYMHLVPAHKATGSGEGSAAISSQILNAERAGGQGGKGDPEGGGDG